MAQPPKSTPHSDIDGVHAQERRNTDVASELGNSAEDLKKSREGNSARPPYSDDKENVDDRTG
jgi:hypothetical protein